MYPPWLLVWFAVKEFNQVTILWVYSKSYGFLIIVTLKPLNPKPQNPKPYIPHIPCSLLTCRALWEFEEVKQPKPTDTMYASNSSIWYVYIQHIQVDIYIYIYIT